MVLYRSRSNEEVRTVAPQRRAVLRCWSVTDCYHCYQDTAVSTYGARYGPYNRTWTEENCIRFLSREIIGSNPELRSTAKLVTNDSMYKYDTIKYKVGKKRTNRLTNEEHAATYDHKFWCWYIYHFQWPSNLLSGDAHWAVRKICDRTAFLTQIYTHIQEFHLWILKKTSDKIINWLSGQNEGSTDIEHGLFEYNFIEKPRFNCSDLDTAIDVMLFLFDSWQS